MRFFFLRLYQYSLCCTSATMIYKFLILLFIYYLEFMLPLYVFITFSELRRPRHYAHIIKSTLNLIVPRGYNSETVLEVKSAVRRRDREDGCSRRVHVSIIVDRWGHSGQVGSVLRRCRSLSHGSWTLPISPSLHRQITVVTGFRRTPGHLIEFAQPRMAFFWSKVPIDWWSSQKYFYMLQRFLVLL